MLKYFYVVYVYRGNLRFGRRVSHYVYIQRFDNRNNRSRVRNMDGDKYWNGLERDKYESHVYAEYISY
mgnify:CR=1 FL=1